MINTPITIHFEKMLHQFGEFPFIVLHPQRDGSLAPACNMAIVDQMRNGGARIITNGLKLQSIFSLAVIFKKDNKQFVYRSDKFPVNVHAQYRRMVELATKNKNTTTTMQLYDNRRAAPDNLLLKWSNGVIVYQNSLLPFSTPDREYSPRLQTYINHLLTLDYTNLPYEELQIQNVA